MKKLLLILFLFLSSSVYGYDFPSLPYNLQPGQLISAQKIMADYNALKNGMIDGTKKLNIAQLWIGNNLVIDDDLDITAKDGTFSGDISVADDATITDDLAVGGDVSITGALAVTGNLDVTGSITIDNLNLAGNTLSSALGGIAITPVAGSAVTIDTSLTVDGGVVALTGDLTVDNLNLNGNEFTSTSGAINITPFAGSNIALDTNFTVDGGVVALTGDLTVDNLNLNGNTLSSTFSPLVLTPIAGSPIVLDQNFTVDGGVVALIGDLTVDDINLNGTTIDAGDNNLILDTLDNVILNGGVDIGGEGTFIMMKGYDLPTWNMQASGSVSVQLVGNMDYVLSVSVIIFSDLNALPVVSFMDAGHWVADDDAVAQINLFRDAGGKFNSTDYDGTSVSRGRLFVTMLWDES